MSTTKLTTTLSGILIVIAFSSAVFEARHARQADEALASTMKADGELRQQLHLTDGRLAALQSESGQFRTEIAELTDQVTANPKITKPPGLEGVPDLVFTNPDARAIYLKARHAKNWAAYDRFFGLVDLTPEDQETFIALTTGRLEDQLDAAEVVRSNGRNLTPEADAKIIELLDTSRQANEQAISGLLGTDGYEQYLEYQQTLDQLPAVDALAVRLYHTDAPLTAEEADDLTQILAENSFDPEAAGSRADSVAGEPISATAAEDYSFVAAIKDEDALPLITDAALDEAEGVLEPAQLAELQQLQAQQLSQINLAPVILGKSSP